MSLERRLREHFDAAGSGLHEPDPKLATVVKRGRRRVAVRNGAVAAGTLAVAAAAVLSFQGLSRTEVEFEPAAPPSSTVPTPEQTWGIATEATPPPSEATSEPPAPRPSDPAPGVGTVHIRRLGASVFAYDPNAGWSVSDEDSFRSVGDERVLVAFPDRRGGMVMQTRARDVIWFPDLDPDAAVPLDHITALAGGREDSEVTLRGVDADGTVVFSTRPAEHYEEGIVERFYSAPLEGGEPQLLTEEGAYESWFIGPASTAEGRVMAGCHLMCSLYRWPEEDDTFPGPEALYHGGGGKAGPAASIDGLTATHDGSLVAFLETGQTVDANNEIVNTVPELVVLDGATFKTRLRLQLPVDNETSAYGAALSISADGQRILASLGAGASSVPRFTLLIDRALTEKPEIRQVDYRGVVRWINPSEVEMARD